MGRTPSHSSAGRLVAWDFWGELRRDVHCDEEKKGKFIQVLIWLETAGQTGLVRVDPRFLDGR